MQREWDLNEVTDGKFYTENDMVKVGCNDCEGCSSCCHGMGNSIVLDPFDIYRITTNLNLTFEQLLDQYVELNVVDGIVLPNLKMAEGTDACSFLNEQGRCSIHPYRSGICRLFPLGRFYEDHDFKYFLQVHECAKPNKTKMKVSKWLDTPNLSQYHSFIVDWHYFLKAVENMLQKTEEAEQIKTIQLYLLKTFFIQPYEVDNFHKQFYARVEGVRKIFGELLEMA